MARAPAVMKHFPFFLAVAEEQSFHRAALRLNIAQSALSRRIADLERELGDTLLFERQARGARLTESGRILLDDVRRILADVDEAVRRVQRSAEGSLGSLNVSFTEGMVRRELLPRALRQFREAYPQITLRFSPMTSDLQREKVRGGEVDVGFIYEEESDRAEFALAPVGPDTIGVVMAHDHPLAKRSAVKLADIAEEPLIFPSRRHSPRLYDRMISAFAAKNLSPTIVAEVATVDVSYGLVAAGIGTALVISAERATIPDDVTIKPLADFAIPIRLSMIWRKGDDAPILANFIRTFEAARDETPGA